MNITDETLHGYQIGRTLGRGGFGTVYRAWQEAVKREVAVKVIRPELADDPSFVRRFEREAQTIARLEHPHVVPLYDYWREPGGVYLVMRLMRGGSLATRPDLGHAELVRILREVADAVDSAHRKGVIHRDLKPSNVLLDEDGRAYLADFGLARDTTRSDESNPELVVGTPSYMSPEQAAGRPLTGRSDLYSLGILVFFMLTGQQPRRDDAAALPDLRTLDPTHPAAVDEVLKKATAADPDARQASARELACRRQGDLLRPERGRLEPQGQLRVLAYPPSRLGERCGTSRATCPCLAQGPMLDRTAGCRRRALQPAAPPVYPVVGERPMRKFNTAGPCNPERHYLIPPEGRLPEARPLVDGQAYFVLHAPRQTGKTTTLLTLAAALTAEGRYAALYMSCETGEPAQDDFRRAQEAMLSDIALRASIYLAPELRPPSPWPQAPDATLLQVGLEAWCRNCPRPVVLFLDEIDALRGESLRSVLRQLRAAYSYRPGSAPWAVALCGMRDVRDYKAASGGDPSRLGTSSPFNIKTKSLRLGDFTATEVRALYAQHSVETGQPFADGAIEHAVELTGGQPWLVNALAREVTEEMGVAPPVPITREVLDEAKERLILARATHLDSLVARLGEPRVRRVIEPLIAGAAITGDTYNDDVAYVRDLGLLSVGPPLRVANPIYREVIVRVLGASVEDNVVADPRSFILADGRLDFPRLLGEFTEFWREHGEVLTAGTSYHEVAPQLVVMAYLQRIVNGGGFIEREYGVGRGRIDLLVRWPYTAADGARAVQREALELKVWRAGRPDPLTQGLAQLDQYLISLGLDRGTLVVFDRRPDAEPIEARTRFEEATTAGGRPVRVLRA